MIFYFTGTGNSLMAAKAIVRSGEALINIAKARKLGLFNYEIQAGERVGFVFPVYCYTVPAVVMEFVRKLELSDCGYCFAIITCGGGIGSAGNHLAKELCEKGISLNYLSPVVMPDNAVFYYNLDPQDKMDMLLSEAEKRLMNIRSELDKETVQNIKPKSSKLCQTMYHAMSKTKGFYVTEACISCGMCAENCPDGIIKIHEGKPIWPEKSCTHCTACINRCPVSAIQYGKTTEKRRRYVNPILNGEEQK